MLQHLLPLVKRIAEVQAKPAAAVQEQPASSAAAAHSPPGQQQPQHSAPQTTVPGGFSAFMERQQQTLERREADARSVQRAMEADVAAARRGMSKGSRRMLASGDVQRRSLVQRAQEESKESPPQTASSWQDSPPRSVRPLHEVLSALAPPPPVAAAHSPAVKSRAAAERSSSEALTADATVHQVLSQREPRDAETVSAVLAGTWTYPGQGDSLYAAALQQRSRLAAAQQAAEAEANNNANQRKQSAGSARLVARRLAAEVCSAVVDCVWKGLSGRGHAGATWVLLQKDCWWHALLSLPEVVAVACALGFFSSPWEALLRGILAQEGGEGGGIDTVTSMGPAWSEASTMRAVWKALVGAPVPPAAGAAPSSEAALPTSPGRWAVPRAETGTGAEQQALDITWCVRAGRVLSLLRQLVADGAQPAGAELTAGGAKTGLLSAAQASAAWDTGVSGLAPRDVEEQQRALGEMAEHLFGLGLAGAFVPEGVAPRDAVRPQLPADGIPAEWPDALVAKCRPLYSCRLSHLRSMKYSGDERGVTLATHRTAPGAAHGDKGAAAAANEAMPAFAPLLCKRSMQLAEGGALPGAGRVPLHTAQAMVAAAQSKHPQVSHSYTLMAYGEAKAAKAAAAREAADAHEMQECSFQPDTGATRQYTEAVSALHHATAQEEVGSALGVAPQSVKVAPRAARALHLQRLHQRHQARMDALREAADAKARAQEEAELAECTFTPAVNPRSALVEASRRRSAAAATSGRKPRPGASVPPSTAPRPKGYAAHLNRQARSRAAAQAEADARLAVEEGRVPGRAVVRDASGRTVQAPFALGRSKPRSGGTSSHMGALHDGVVLPAGVSPAVLKSAVSAVASSYQAAAAHEARHTARSSRRAAAALDATMESHATHRTQPSASVEQASPMPRLSFGAGPSAALLTSPPAAPILPRPALPPAAPLLGVPPVQTATPARGPRQDGPPAVYVDVALSKERTQRVPLWRHSDVAAVAATFAAEHGLKASKARKLEVILQQQLQAVIDSQ